MRISGLKIKRVKHLNEFYRWKISRKYSVKFRTSNIKTNKAPTFIDGYDWDYEYVGELLIQSIHKGDMCIHPIAWSDEVPVDNTTVCICINNALNFGWDPRSKTSYPFYVLNLFDTIDSPTLKAQTRLVRKTMDV